MSEIITFVVGETINETFLITDAGGRKEPRDLTGAVFEFATAAFSATVTIKDQVASKGQISINLSSAASALVAIKAYPFQLFVTYPTGVVEVVLEGMIYPRKSERVP